MILLVDDDIDDLELFQESLNRKYSGDSLQLRNGLELMQLLSTHNEETRLIILDLNMPIKDGFETLREIKADRILKRIPVVVLSASSNEKDKTECLRLGCSMFVRKPETVAGYNEIVDSVLSLLDRDGAGSKS